LEKRVRPLAEKVNATVIEALDVGEDEQLDAFFAKVEAKWGKMDFLVHSIAFANKDALRNPFSECTREDFQLAMDISAFSFVACAQRAAKIMNDGGSMVTMTYLGAERAVPGYGMMGVAKAALEASTRYLAQDLGKRDIRVNAVSAGPIRTLAASAVGDFPKLMEKSARGSMLGRNVTQDEVGNTTAYLLSDLSTGVSGEVHYVDAGFHVGAGDPGVDLKK
jgi:enoyl-[acyl-carrier protein] reductase I